GTRRLGGYLPLALFAPPLAAPLVDGRNDPVETTLVIAFLILSLALHEVAHGWVALRCGDTTARDLGRLSLNPIVHIDIVWTLIVPALTYMAGGILFGGAKPVPVDFRRLRSPLRDMALVAVVGPLTNFLLAALFLVAWKAAVWLGPYEPESLLARVLEGSMQFNAILFVFNLIPIPPLDGSRIMAWLLPPGLREPYTSFERYGMIVIIGLLFFVPPFQRLLWGGFRSTIQFLETITGTSW
ncbi:MAG TPA: site-2 protease family protein, partial [Planctomycetota bacterium]|nr:site-2 protease family protein [Planctomycetota bacterium]